jgi:hypothetical protein
MPKIAPCCPKMEEIISREYPPIWLDSTEVPLAYNRRVQGEDRLLPFLWSEDRDLLLSRPPHFHFTNQLFWNYNSTIII